MLFFGISVFAQKSELKGVIIDFGTGSPVVGAKVSLKVKNVSVPSVKNGKFIFKNLSPGADELIIESPGYQTFTQNILIKKGEKIDLGNIALIKTAGVVPKSEENIRLFD